MLGGKGKSKGGKCSGKIFGEKKDNKAFWEECKTNILGCLSCGQGGGEHERGPQLFLSMYQEPKHGAKKVFWASSTPKKTPINKPGKNNKEVGDKRSLLWMSFGTNVEKSECPKGKKER